MNYEATTGLNLEKFVEVLKSMSERSRILSERYSSESDYEQKEFYRGKAEAYMIVADAITSAMEENK